LELNGIQLGKAGQSRAYNLQTQTDGPSEPDIPYLQKGKWKAVESDDESFQEACKAQIEADHEAADQVERHMRLKDQATVESENCELGRKIAKLERKVS
jgi:hypothetical protein